VRLLDSVYKEKRCVVDRGTLATSHGRNSTSGGHCRVWVYCELYVGGVHDRPMAAKRVLSEIDDVYGGTRDSVEMALDSTSTEGVL
jgi:hypothetical protein